MKIKRYKLKDGITVKDLLDCGVKQGKASWIMNNSVYYICKNISIKHKADKKTYIFEFDIDIGFKKDISDWNDFDNVLVLDSDFCQPYTAFYGDNYGKEITNFPVLKKVIEEYNKYMDGLEFLEEVVNNGN